MIGFVIECNKVFGQDPPKAFGEAETGLAIPALLTMPLADSFMLA